MESIFWIWLCSIFPEAANELQSFRWPLYQHKGPVLPVATANLLTRCRRDSTLSYERSSDSRANSHTPSYLHQDFVFHSVLFSNLIYASYSICKGFKWDGSMNKTRQPFQSLSVSHLQWTTSYWVRAEATLSPLRNRFSWHRWQEKLVRDRLIFRLAVALRFHIMRALFTSLLLHTNVLLNNSALRWNVSAVTPVFSCQICSEIAAAWTCSLSP